MPAKATLRRLKIEWVACLCAVLVFTGLIQAGDVLLRFDLAVYDSLLEYDARPAHPDILVVAVDDTSLRLMGRWPWPLDVHARLIDRLRAARPRAVALDIMFSEPTSGLGTDAVLAHSLQALKAVSPVFLPVTAATPLMGGGAAEALRPIPLLENAATGLGHINVELDADSVVRSLYLNEGTALDRWPALPLALARVHAGKDATPKTDGPEWPSRGAEWFRRDRALIPFSGAAGHHRTVSYSSLLNGEVPDAVLRDKIVLVGLTAPGLGDQFPTPFSDGSGLTPGVEITAAVLDGLLQDRMLHPTGPALRAITTTLALLGWMVWLWHSGPRTGLLGLSIISLLAVGCTAAMHLVLHLWLPVATWLVAALLGYLLWSWRRIIVLLNDLYRRVNTMQSGGIARPSHDGWQHIVDALDRGLLAEQQAHRQRIEALQLLSHDLRAPQSAVLALLRNDPPQSPQSTLLYERIDRQVRTTLALADDFVMQLRAEGEEYAWVEVDLVQLLTEVYERVWPLAQEKGIELALNLPPHGLDDDDNNSCWMRMEPRLLGRALFNLVENSVKYSPTGSTTSLALAWATDERVSITVNDEGNAIPTADLPHLFERYSRFQATECVPGHGLGLSLVKTVVERHQGTVGVNSVLGMGTTFTIVLPRTGFDVTLDRQRSLAGPLGSI